MIRPLRQRHRIAVFALSVLLPAFFGLGIASRRNVPTVGDLPFVSTGEAGDYSELWTRDDLWPKISFNTRLLMEKNNPAIHAIKISPKENIARADLLLYWVRGEASSLDVLPEDAILLGAFIA